MERKLTARSYLLSLLFLLIAFSCKKEVADMDSRDPMTCGTTAGSDAGTGRSNDLLKAVRQATSRFNSTTQAIQAGYNPTTHCVSVPGLGGMGYHWANPSLIDGTFDPLQPEVMLYATGPGGNLKLVAVEYVVMNTGQTAPMFGTQAFMTGGAPIPAPHWTLHVWVHEHNPSGVFAPFNPNVTCP